MRTFRIGRNSRGLAPVELLIVGTLLFLLVVICALRFDRLHTRSKVSRVHDDFAVISRALSAYRADRGAYPRHAWGCEPYLDEYRGKLRWSILTPSITTPVAYLDDYPADPFAVAGYDLVIDEVYTYENTSFGAVLSRINSSCPVPEQPGQVYVPPSGGQLLTTNYYFGDFFLWSLGPDGVANSGSSFFLQYDPTNGMISDGNIIGAERFEFPQAFPATPFSRGDREPSGAPR